MATGARSCVTPAALKTRPGTGPNALPGTEGSPVELDVSRRRSRFDADSMAGALARGFAGALIAMAVAGIPFVGLTLLVLLVAGCVAVLVIGAVARRRARQ